MFKTFVGSDQSMGPVSAPSSRGPSQVTGPGGWHPTILYLFVLLAAEVFLVGLLSRTVLR
jgi:hypothetical protein